MERDEDRTVVQERSTSFYHPISFVHNHTVLRVDYYVSSNSTARNLVQSLPKFGVMRPPSITLTPTYCRAYLPTLIPVEVDESKTKPWFRSLLSGIEFLHKRGVVHNDIKCVTTILILLRDAP